MTQPRTSDLFRSPLERPLALTLVLLAVALVALRAVPELLPWHVAPLGALALFSAARLRGLFAFALPLLVRFVTDLVIWWQYDFLYAPFDPFSYVALGLTLVLGVVLLRRTSNGFAVTGTAILVSVMFFLITNFGAWLVPEMNYPRNITGLIMAYEMGLPFYRNQLVGDVVVTVTLFALHRVLAPVLSPSERPVNAAVGVEA